MSGRKAFCCKSNIILVRDKYMFSIVEYRILILFDRPLILGNVTFPISWTLFLSRNVLTVNVFSLAASECSSPLLWVCYYDSGYIHEQCNYWQWNVTSQPQQKEKLLLFRVMLKIEHTWPKEYPAKFHCHYIYIYKMGILWKARKC